MIKELFLTAYSVCLYVIFLYYAYVQKDYNKELLINNIVLKILLIIFLPILVPMIVILASLIRINKDINMLSFLAIAFQDFLNLIKTTSLIICYGKYNRFGMVFLALIESIEILVYVNKTKNGEKLRSNI